MLYFLYVLFIIICFFLVQNILFRFFHVENKKVRQKYQKIKAEKKAVISKSHIFSRWIYVSRFKRQQMLHDFKLLNLDPTYTPENYYSECIYKTLPLALLSIILFLLHQELFAFSFIVISIFLFIHYKNRLSRDMILRKINIEAEIPSFMRFFITEITNNTNIVTIFEKYQEISGYLKKDIEETILELNATIDKKDNIIHALQNFAMKIDLPIMQDFSSGLIDVVRGKNQENYFVLLEKEIRQISIKNLNRKTASVEKKVRISTFILIFSFIFILLSIIFIYMANSLFV